jgi:hypothetical protein
MPEFKVYGEYKISVKKNKRGSIIEKDSIEKFWTESKEEDLIGCYIFGLRTGGGIIPHYIGKATRSFRQECFTADKLRKYYHIMSDRNGTPVMFFVATTRNGSKIAVAEIEKYLINNAINKNPDLFNIKHTKQPAWCIKGIVRSGCGNTSLASQKLKRSIGL